MTRRKINDGKTAYQRWYEKHGAKHNAKRRKKYKTDPDIRKKAVEQAKTYREKRKLPSATTTVPWGTTNINAYSRSKIAKWLGMAPSTLHAWEAKEWIPEPTDGMAGMYTRHQALLMQRLHELLQEYTHADEVVTDYQDTLWETWNE